MVREKRPEWPDCTRRVNSVTTKVDVSHLRHIRVAVVHVASGAQLRQR